MAAAGFRIRRVKTESSLGDKLKKTRIRKKISVSQVEDATKIRAKFILALESDSWEQIPSEAYGRGYLERYAQFLQIPVEVIMRQYARERELYAGRCKDSGIELSPKSTLRLPRFAVTPRLIAGLGLASVLAVGGGAVGYQLKTFTAAPFIELAAPLQAASGNASELVVSTESFTVAGRTTQGAEVIINGEVVEVGADGGFRHPLSLQQGTNAIVVEAINANGKKTEEVLTVVVR